MVVSGECSFPIAGTEVSNTSTLFVTVTALFHLSVEVLWIRLKVIRWRLRGICPYNRTLCDYNLRGARIAILLDTSGKIKFHLSS